MWTKVFLLAAALALIGILYLVERFHRFYFLEQLAKKQKRLSWLLAALLVTGILSSGLIFNWYTMALIIIHLVLIWLLCDLIGWIIRKCRISSDSAKNIVKGTPTSSFGFPSSKTIT